jgi:hypothetical protein
MDKRFWIPIVIAVIMGLPGWISQFRPTSVTVVEVIVAAWLTRIASASEPL